MIYPISPFVMPTSMIFAIRSGISTSSSTSSMTSTGVNIVWRLYSRTERSNFLFMVLFLLSSIIFLIT